MSNPKKPNTPPPSPQVPSRKPRFHGFMRRVERVVEYVALVVHIVVIGEGLHRILIIVAA